MARYNVSSVITASIGWELSAGLKRISIMGDAEALVRLRASLADNSDLIAEVLAHAGKTPDRWRNLPIGRCLRWLRIRLGLKQEQAAKLAGMTQSQVAKIERGLDVRLSTLGKLLSGYGCRPLFLPLSDQTIAQLRKRTDELFPQRTFH